MEFTEVSSDVLAEIQAGSKSGYATEALNAFRDSGLSAADFTNAFPGRKTSNVVNALKRQTSKSEYSDIKVVTGKYDGEDRIILTRA